MTKSLSKNKNLEIDSRLWPKKDCSKIFNFQISWSFKGDHAGFELTFDIYRYYFSFNIYDARHWDYDNNCWEKYDD